MNARNILHFHILFLSFNLVYLLVATIIDIFSHGVFSLRRKKNNVFLFVMCCGEITVISRFLGWKWRSYVGITAFRTFLRALMSLSAHGEKASIFYLQSPRATELNVETREAFIVYIAIISQPWLCIYWFFLTVLIKEKHKINVRHII